ncbi:glycine N-acyltransferase-like isoform X1 [Halichondria panicea]|uniref:glycine N-acyltransferase-like isoform X1 n=1 Tax=Halichondria panicea TaxID=6063 RepID=UPI00312BC492
MPVLKVKESDLAKLKRQLLLGLPKSARVVDIITNVQSEKLEANLYLDKWPDFSAVVAQLIWPRISEVADISAYTTSSKALVSVLTEGKLIAWGNRQYIKGIESEHADYFLRNIDCDAAVKVKEFNTLSCVYVGTPYHFTRSEEPPKIECPESYFIGKLQPHHFKIVSDSWPYYHDMPHREHYIKYSIEHYESIGLFTMEFPTIPISFMVQFPDGQMGFGYTAPEYRGKGLYSIVKNEMCRALLLAGYSSPNYDTSETAPPPSPESMFEFCGYRIKSFVLK